MENFLNVFFVSIIFKGAVNKKVQFVSSHQNHGKLFLDTNVINIFLNKNFENCYLWDLASLKIKLGGGGDQ